MKNIQVFCPERDLSFAQTICEPLKASLGLCQTKHFPNGEFLFQINEDVKGNDVIILKRFSEFLHQDIWELLQMVHVAHRMQAKSITFILPYLPYVRQHRCSSTSQFSTCQLLVNLLKAAGADKIITIDMHAPEQCAELCLPVINIPIEPFWINYLQTQNLNWAHIGIFGADKSASVRTETIAKHFKCNWGYFDKKRDAAGHIAIQGIHGNCRNQHIFLIDDLIDTGATIIRAVRYLKDSGALDITVLATHCSLDKKLMETLAASPIRKLIFTDTHPISLCPTINFSIEQVSVKDTLVGIIESID